MIKADNIENILTGLAVIVAIWSIIISLQVNARSKRAEKVNELLGEKESVAFAAMKLINGNKLPEDEIDRKMMISAIMNACLFERSDRARTLLYYVIELNRGKYLHEFKAGFETISKVINSMKEYQFEKKVLDLSSAENRLEGVRAILDGEKPVKHIQ